MKIRTQVAAGGLSSIPLGLVMKTNTFVNLRKFWSY